MLRHTLIAALATVGCLSFAQDMSAKINFKAPAAPAKRVFEELSKVAGVSMTAAGPVGDDVLLLNLSDVTVTDTMDKIAAALNAEWRKEGAGWVLARGSNIEAAEKRAEIAARVAEFRANLNKTLEDQKKLGDFNAAAAKKIVDQQNKMNEEISRQSGPIRLSGNFNDVSRQTPSARAIAALLSRMSDAQIAALVSEGRVVFGLNPTRMQLPMPGGANQILQRFVKDTQTFKDVAQRNEPAQTGESRRVVINGFGGDEGGDGDPKLGIGYAILVKNPNMGGSPTNVSVSLSVADPNGKTIATGQFFVGPNFSVTAPGAQPQPQAPTTNEKPLLLSENAKELAKVLVQLNGGGGGGVAGVAGVRMVSVAISSGGGGTFTLGGGGGAKTPQLSDDLREKILNPEKYDPMSFVPSEALTQISDLRGKDLVAYLPDAAFVPLHQAASGSPTPTSFLTTATGVAALKINDANGWMVISPKNPSSAREKKVNRAALGASLRVMNSKGYISLDDWAAFATRQPKAPRMGEIDESYLRMINNSAADEGLGQFSYGGGWQTLQFYASMSNGQRQALQQNGRIPLRTLSQFQMGIVNDQIFNSFDGPQVSRTPGEPGRAMIMGMGGVNTERTLLLPNGMPRDGFLNLTLKTNEIAQASSNDAGSKFMNAESIAFERVRAERPELASFGPSVNYDQYRMASQRSIAFQFQLTPEMTLYRQLQDNTPGNLPFSAYDRLPADFKAKVEKAYESLKKGWGGGFGGGGNQVPPPQ